MMLFLDLTAPVNRRVILLLIWMFFDLDANQIPWNSCTHNYHSRSKHESIIKGPPRFHSRQSEKGTESSVSRAISNFFYFNPLCLVVFSFCFRRLVSKNHHLDPSHGSWWCDQSLRQKLVISGRFFGHTIEIQLINIRFTLLWTCLPVLFVFISLWRLECEV